MILDQFVVDPDASVCPITYSCSVSGPNTNICDTSAADGAAIFDTTTGGYTFETLDLVTYPEGDYVFTITGKVGLKEVSSTFTMTVVDPCPTTTLTINNPVPFMTGEYVLRDN